MSIEDRLMIEDLFIRYARANDAGDADILVGCFTEDAVLETCEAGTGKLMRGFSGAQGVRDFAARSAARAAAFRGEGTHLRHFVSNLAIAFAGDTARVTAYLTTVLTRGGKTEVAVPGVYVCEAARQNGEWRFRRRRVTMDSTITAAGV